jgi:hypothetical protein
VTLALAGLALGIWLVSRDAPSPERPRVDTLFWVETDLWAREGDSEEAGWWSFDETADEWTRRALGDALVRRELPAVIAPDREGLNAPAEAVGPEPPAVEMLADEPEGTGRRLRLGVRSPRGGEVMRLLVEAPGGLTGAAVDGRALQTALGERLALIYHAVPTAGFELELVTASPARPTLTMADQSYGLPVARRGAVGERPADSIPRPGWLTDSTLVLRRVVL